MLLAAHEHEVAAKGGGTDAATMKRKNLEAAMALVHKDPLNTILDQSRMLSVEGCSDE